LSNKHFGHVLNPPLLTFALQQTHVLPMLNVVLFGPPGSGKGTQSVRLAEAFNLVHISTGDIFREELKNETPLGMEARKFMDKGMLVPDEVVIGMLGSKLDASLVKNPKGFIFDGFPRTITQAEALDRLMHHKHMSITGVLALEVSEEELVKRIRLRGESSGRADDVNEATIRKRIEVYRNETEPVAGYYEIQGKLQRVKGEGGIEDIFGSLAIAIQDLS
jgi:adenylate kinase